MNNDEEKIDKLLQKFYDASIEQDEIDHLCHYFLHTDEVPHKWQADAAILQYIGIERYCHRHRAEMENFIKNLPPTQKKQKPHHSIWHNYTYRAVTAVVGLILTVGATIQMSTAMPKNNGIPRPNGGTNQHIPCRFNCTIGPMGLVLQRWMLYYRCSKRSI